MLFSRVIKMRYSIFALLLIARPSIAGYVLEDDYNPTSFLSMFNAYTGSDPTDGFGESTVGTAIKANTVQSSMSTSRRACPAD
jgi:hypothetical protein